MKLLQAPVLLVVGKPSLVRATRSISTIGEHLSHIRATLETLPVVFANNTVPLSFYSAAAGLPSTLDAASNALQLHGNFTEEEGNTIFLAVQDIQLVIDELADSVWTWAAILAEFDAEGVPASLVDDLIMAGPAARQFQRTLSTAIYAPVFARVTETYRALHLSIVGDVVGFERSRGKRQWNCQDGCTDMMCN
ncbi:hypothetical protein B0H14DRAFT_2829569 [Mycena olivaceomarginata]|nr:hypothetical protein B0H14DRAFT_2829569 [Mycena olivaceomarginata]